MKLTSRQRAVLLGVLHDRDAWAVRESVSAFEPRPLDAREIRDRDRIQDARAGRVRCSPADWLGHALTASEHTMVSRTYRQLEARGLVERLTLGYDGSVTTHLLLTREGERVARDLESGEVRD